MESLVHVEKLDHVTLVTLDRPEVRNAVDARTARALYEAFLAFEADDAARVAVFHGAHGHFCAGWDLQYGARMQQAGGAAEVFADLDYPVDAPPVEGGETGPGMPAAGPPGPMGRRACCCPSRWSPPLPARRWPAAWSWRCGATCG